AGFTGETAFFVFTLIVVVAGIAAVEWLRTGRLGTVLQALAASPAGVESIGVNPTASRVLVFTASAFLAAIAGGLLGSVTQTVSPATFTATDSLVWLAVLVAAGPTSFSGAVLAGLLYNQLPALVSSSTILDWLPVGFGVAAVVLAQTPDGLSGLLHLDFARLAATSRHRLSRSPHRVRPVRRPVAHCRSGVMLTVTNLRAGYGAIEVLHGIDLAVPAGSVVAVL